MLKIAIKEEDVPIVLDNLSDEEKVSRLKKLYLTDEILEILGFYDGSLEDEICEKIESLESNPTEWEKYILDLAKGNGNFEEAIAYYKYLKI
jgi:hypothetical protein